MRDEKIKLKRIYSSWSSYNESTHIGLLQYNDSQVEIDITQTQNSLPREGEIIQCIGEIIGEVYQAIFYEFCLFSDKNLLI